MFITFLDAFVVVQNMPSAKPLVISLQEQIIETFVVVLAILQKKKQKPIDFLLYVFPSKIKVSFSGFLVETA